MTNENYILLHSNGSFETVTLDADKLLNEFYKAIDCDCIETVSVGKIADTNILLIVDESGVLKGKPVNLLASPLYSGTAYGNPIVGDALLATTGFRAGDPDIVGFNDHQLQDINKCIDFLQCSLKTNMHDRMATAQSEADRRNSAATTPQHKQEHER